MKYKKYSLLMLMIGMLCAPIEPIRAEFSMESVAEGLSELLLDSGYKVQYEINPLKLGIQYGCYLGILLATKAYWMKPLKELINDMDDLMYGPYDYLDEVIIDIDDKINGDKFDDKHDKDDKNSNFGIFHPGDIKITFKDVAGLEGAKEDMQDIIEFLKNPEIFTNMGAKIPKGILMEGGPGNGKTLLAKAVAGEVNCPFITVSGSSFVEMYVGVGPKRVRELFAIARENAPCIIFIDEIDALISKRSGNGGGGQSEYNNTVNAFLVEMDGLSDANSGIIVLGATNRAALLDEAATRPGRFDRTIQINKPFIKDRIQLLENAFAKIELSDDVNIDHIARGTAGFSGAELANLVNEALILAVKDKSTVLSLKHVEMAYDIITLGRENKGMVQSDDDLKVTAIHEAGHLIGFLFQDKTVAVHKVSIVPRGDTLGVAHMLPLVESYSVTKSSMKNKIVSCLAGRYAEEAFGFEPSTGASSDLKRARQIAHEMVVTYGMGDDLQDMAFNPYEERLPNDIANRVYAEVEKIVKECAVITRNLIATHKDDIEKIANLLIEKRTVLGDEIYSLLNLSQPQGVCFNF